MTALRQQRFRQTSENLKGDLKWQKQLKATQFARRYVLWTRDANSIADGLIWDTPGH